MNLPPQIAALIRLIRSDLAVIGTRIREVHDAVREQSPPDKVRAVISLDEETARNAQADQNRQHTTQRSVAWATWLAFIAASIYAAIAAVTLSEIRRSNMLDERAWVGLKDFKVGTLEAEKNIVVEVDFINSGKSLANKVQGNATLAVSDSRTLQEFPMPPGPPAESVGIYWPGVDLKIFVSGTAKTPEHRFAFDKSGLENIFNNRAFLFVYGAYTYVDIFDRPHTTRFCARYSPDAPAGFDFCANYNYAD